MSREPLWISEADVGELIDLRDGIDVLASAYRLERDGAAATMRRAHLREGDAILHAVGGTIAGESVAGTKTWTYTPGGAAPLVVLFSLVDGSVQAIVEAFALGQLRTAATSGLGTRVLARPEASSLALLGTGKQAFAQAQAVSLVRPICCVRVFGRNADRRTAMVLRLRDELGVIATAHADPADAIVGADVVTAITRSAEPFVSAAMLEPGMHINAVGAIVPTRRELDEAAVGRCSVVVVDSPDQARDDAGELRAAVASRALVWEVVRPLTRIVDRDVDELRSPTDITLFKALGLGLSDVALAAEILRRARAAGIGRPLPSASAAEFPDASKGEQIHDHR